MVFNNIIIKAIKKRMTSIFDKPMNNVIEKGLMMDLKNVYSYQHRTVRFMPRNPFLNVGMIYDIHKDRFFF